MSDTDNKLSTTPNGKGWTGRQRLAYYFSLVEHSNVKLDFATAPRPQGKSVGACRIMVDRLKGTLKADLAALRGEAENETTATAKKAVTPRKRKAKGDLGAGDGDMAVKRGRKKMVCGEVVEKGGEDEVEGDVEIKVKDEVLDED